MDSIEVEYHEFDTYALANLLRGKNLWTSQYETTYVPEEHRARIPDILARRFIEPLTAKIEPRDFEFLDETRINESRKVSRAEMVFLTRAEAEEILTFLQMMTKHFKGPVIRYAKPPKLKVSL